MGRPFAEKGRFGKVFAKTWRDEVFRSLTPDSQRLWLYMLSSPQATPIPGLMVMSLQTAAADLGIEDQAALECCLSEIIDENLAEFDPDTEVLWIPKAIHYDPPSEPKNVAAWLKIMPLIPECELKEKAVDALWDSGQTFDLEKPAPSKQPKRRVSVKRTLKKYGASDGASDAHMPYALFHQPSAVSQTPRARENEKQVSPSASVVEQKSPLGQEIERVFFEERGVAYEWDFVSENSIRSLIKHGDVEILRRWRIGLRTAFPACNAVSDLARTKNWNAYGTEKAPGFIQDAFKPRNPTLGVGRGAGPSEAKYDPEDPFGGSP